VITLNHSFLYVFSLLFFYVFPLYDMRQPEVNLVPVFTMAVVLRACLATRQCSTKDLDIHQRVGFVIAQGVFEGAGAVALNTRSSYCSLALHKLRVGTIGGDFPYGGITKEFNHLRSTVLVYERRLWGFFERWFVPPMDVFTSECHWGSTK